MAMKTGADWYKRDPQKFISGVIGMSSKQIAVYTILIELMYSNAGECHNDPKFISGFMSDMGPSSVRKIIEEFIANGKVIVTENGRLSNKTVQKLAKTREETKEKRRISGKKGGEKSSEIRLKPIDNGALGKPNGLTDVQPDKNRLDKSSKRDTKVSPKKRASRIPDDWFLSKELGDWSVSQGYGIEHIRIEAEKFKDYWIGVGGQKGRKLDWNATWRNWIRNSKGHTNGKFNGSNQTTNMANDPALEQIARLTGLGPTSG